MARIELLHGSSLELLAKMPEGCIDLVVTDPPYKIGTGETPVTDQREYSLGTGNFSSTRTTSRLASGCH